MPSKKRIILNFAETYPLWTWKHVANYLGIDRYYKDGGIKKKTDFKYKASCAPYLESHFAGAIFEVRDKPHFKEKNRPYLRLRKNHTVIDEATRSPQVRSSLEDALSTSVQRAGHRMAAAQEQSRETMEAPAQSFSEHYLEQLQRLVGSGGGAGGGGTRANEPAQVQGEQQVLDVGVESPPRIRRRPSTSPAQAERTRGLTGRVNRLDFDRWWDASFNVPTPPVAGSQANDGGETASGGVPGSVVPPQAASSNSGQQGLYTTSYQFTIRTVSGRNPQVLAGDTATTEGDTVAVTRSNEEAEAEMDAAIDAALAEQDLEL